MVKVFNRSMRTFRLETKDGRFLMIPFKAAVDVPEEFTGDITFKRAVAGHELEVYQVAAEVDKILRQDEEKPVEVKKVEADTVADVNFENEAEKPKKTTRTRKPKAEAEQEG